LLANQPDIQRRIDRLSGVMPSGIDNPVTSLMGFLPGLVEGGALSVSTSLGAVRRLAGDVEPSRFDAWLEGSYTRFKSENENGVSESLGGFGRAALGADWLVNRNLLIGG